MFKFKFLVKESSKDKIVVTHSISTRSCGQVYSDFLQNFMLKILARRISQHQVDKTVIHNTKHWLTFK